MAGVFPAYVEEYLQALRDCVQLQPHPYNIDFQIKPGKKYLKVVQLHNGSGASVHSFIEVETGALLKAASYASPQRNSDGTLAVRYQLADDADRQALVSLLRSTPNAIHGGYLYQR